MVESAVAVQLQRAAGVGMTAAQDAQETFAVQGPGTQRLRDRGACRKQQIEFARSQRLRRRAGVERQQGQADLWRDGEQCGGQHGAGAAVKGVGGGDAEGQRGTGGIESPAGSKQPGEFAQRQTQRLAQGFGARRGDHATRGGNQQRVTESIAQLAQLGGQRRLR
ncbi:hypothetical protein GALL_416070 [mine drainage metagenome]|uniref:Uncharacterized protein n=1 Tax=mine drainage metagenome TaxID=410659 RepID=A0A1J5PZ03_9ZZZZ